MTESQAQAEHARSVQQSATASIYPLQMSFPHTAKQLETGTSTT